MKSNLFFDVISNEGGFISFQSACTLRIKFILLFSGLLWNLLSVLVEVTMQFTNVDINVCRSLPAG